VFAKRFWAGSEAHGRKEAKINVDGRLRNEATKAKVDHKQNLFLESI